MKDKSVKEIKAIIENLKDKEPIIRQILKEQNDTDYLMDMH